jgi:hypothetical protein
MIMPTGGVDNETLGNALMPYLHSLGFSEQQEWALVGELNTLAKLLIDVMHTKGGGAL